MVVDLYMGSNRLTEAASLGVSAVDLCKQAGHKKAQAKAMHMLANIQLMMQDHEGATETISDASCLCKEMGDKQLGAILAILLVQVHVSELAGDPQDQDAQISALKAADASALAAKQAGDKTFYGVALTWRAQVLTLAGRGTEALQSTQASEKIFAQAGDLPNRVRSWVTIAELFLALGKKTDAKDAATKALELVDGNPDLAESEQDAQALLARATERRVARGGGGRRMVRKLVKKWRKKAGSGKSGGLTVAVMQPKLMNLVKSVLSDDGPVDLDTPFMEAGIDSLGSVQLLTDVGKEFQMALAPSAVFDYPTIRDLAEFLLAEGAGASGGGSGGKDEMEEYEDWEEVEEDDDGGGGYEMASPAQASQQLAVAASASAPAKKGLDIKLVKSKLIDLVKAVLSDEGEVLEDSPFMEAGIDSLGSVQLLTDVGKEFQIGLAPSAVFDYPSVRELAGFLVDEIK